MKRTLLLALMSLLCLGINFTAQAQCTSYAGGPYNDQDIDVAGCDGTSLSAPYNAWLNEVYYTDVLAGGNYTFDICSGYDPAAWGGEATITAILNGAPSGAPPGTIDGGTVLGTVTGCSITFDATEDGTVFFIISTEADCGGALVEVENGTPTITTNSGVPCGGCGNGTCDVGESYGNCPGDCPCNTTPVFATFDPTGQPAVSPVPTAFCESFFTGDPAAAPVAYVAVAVFPGDGALYDFTNEDGFDFYGIDATGFFASSQFEPGFIGFMQITDDLIAAAGGTTTINFSDGIGCNGSLTIDWAADFPGLVVADLCGEPVVSTPGADFCEDALTLDVADGAVNGPFSNIAATGEDPAVLVPPACFTDDVDPTTGENYFDNSVWFSFTGTGETLVLTTSVAGAPNPMPNADTQLGVYTGACDGLVEVACNDDIDAAAGNYLSSVIVATEAGITYYVVVDGYYYSDGAGGGAPDAGDFFVNVAVQATTDCLADYGTVIPPAETTVCQDGIIGAFNLEGGNTSADYLSLFVVTTGPELSILGYADAGTDIDLTGLPAGQYTFHAFNFLLADAGAIDAAVSGGATGFDVAALIADGTICADLDAAGISVTILPSTDPACAGFVCEADYGTPIPPDQLIVCENSILGAFNLEGNNASPDYISLFVVTTGPELTILGSADLGTDLDLTGLPAGDYTFHAFNFLASDFDAIDAAISAGATGVDVAALIADGTICADLDVAGVVVTILPATDPACAGFPDLVVSDASTTVGGNQYVVVFTIDSGTGDYTVTPEGNLDGNTFVSNPIDCGTNAEFTVLDNLSQQTAVVSVEAPCSGFVCEANYGMVMSGATTLCEGNFSDPVTVMDNNTNGYTTLLVITQGAELTILGTSDLGSIDFTGFAPGDYTVHALNILDSDIPALLDALNSGAVTTGFDAAALIADGTICADLDVAGIVFTILPANSEICNPQVPPTAANADYNIIVGTESFDVNLWSLVNDANGDILTLDAGSPDQGGSASLDPINGILTFVPDAGFIGTATIPYTVTDGFSDPVGAVVTITVELSCETLEPIGFDVIELISNPVTGDLTSYLLITGGLPGYDGTSTYVLNAFNDEGAVLFSINDIPSGVIYELGPISTGGDDTLDITITDGLGCSKDFVVAVLSGGLDVQLINFTGTVQARGNLLNWATASEVNNDFYTLYRSADGVSYQKIAQVDGKGTTSLANSYQFLDENAPNGTAYYQLAQTDFDGTSITLGTVVLRRNITSLSVVQVAPVPATSAVNVIFAATATERVQISLFDVAGKLVNTRTIDATAGNNNIQIAVDQLPAGVYVLSLNNGLEVATAKIVKE
ncbi:T9SS C-terminal target domain-containing protein [Sphingobacteriales bacterium UPWRP_1]|nr:hypothetical protein B6N25_10605 [Sphingobacteriales bacterium TSM_CSS]PSJ79022.1 T9SS C-terminal target domain-containing protein [Sphingobacteriales bacterium UPWRP_1]